MAMILDNNLVQATAAAMVWVVALAVAFLKAWLLIAAVGHYGDFFWLPASAGIMHL